MNNFDGQLKLYPEVCIDNFSSDVLFNVRIRCYILTHFHDDHMKNLEDLNFYRILKENDCTTKFYCSTITKKFIQTCDKYEHLGEFCQEVTSETPFIVKISQKETITVTFCGSGMNNLWYTALEFNPCLRFWSNYFYTFTHNYVECNLP